ncbi:unnamed protein product [Protopolystoma xenopodis]|uniref:Uncharacterized protein n=1 Tax=Protopolystoma xenopodis TaxID=117903 RepID=A0A3S5CKW7_9PLAT|nr:unnamed protein product [Protopolystoma xenopodis]
MAKLTDDADYDAGETSDAGNHDNYYGRRLRTRYILPSRPDNKTKLRKRGQPTYIYRNETTTTPEATTAWSSYLQSLYSPVSVIVGDVGDAQTRAKLRTTLEVSLSEIQC